MVMMKCWKGILAVTVKCKLKNGKTQTYKYKVKVVKVKKVTALDRAKDAFKIQNQYRKAKGVKALQWSDELYKFCCYRLKTSGFDRHKNLLSADHVCGAIARYGNTWCAIFYNGEKSEIGNWRDYQIKEVKVKRYDSASSSYIGNCSIGYYESDNRWNSQQATTIKEAPGKSIMCRV